MKEKIYIQSDFYGGLSSYDKDRSLGISSNIEEVDIWTNRDFVQAEQIMSADTMPEDTEFYSYCADEDDTVWAYGAKTSTGDVRLCKVTSGGGSDPGTFSSVFTSADTTNGATPLSPVVYHRTSAGNKKFLYYIAKDSSWYIKQYDITGDSESNQDEASTQMALDGLPSSSYPRPFISKLYGELYIGNGNYISKIDADGIFTQHAFTLPYGMEAVGLVPVSDIGLILARSKNAKENKTVCYLWDLEEEEGFNDYFELPIGGPQWVVDINNTKYIFCSTNGIGKFYVYSGFAGTGALELAGKTLTNCALETAAQPVSVPHMVSSKDGKIYFIINKTDKTAIYGLGQLDRESPLALILSKRLHTSDYSKHIGYGLLIHGYNYYAAFSDDGAKSAARCETGNSPSRSSNAVIESTWIDMDDPFKDKQLASMLVACYPLPASTTIKAYIDIDFASSYTNIQRADATNITGTGVDLGTVLPKNTAKNVKYKITFTSNTTNSPKLQAIGIQAFVPDGHASQ